LRTFRQALQERVFTLTAELAFQSETSVDEVLRQADLLSSVVDGFQVAENPQAYMQTSVVALAVLLKRRGLDPIPQLNCRDRNRIALQSDLLGLRALGVTSVMLNKGGRLPAEDETVAAPVFDLNARELVAMAQELNEETDDVARELLIGTNATVCAPGPRWSPDPLLGRAAAGARFLQTQPCFNAKMLRQYMNRLVEDKITWQFAVIVTLAPLPSAAMAERMAATVRDALIPAPLVRRLEQAADPEQEGVDICAGLIREFADIPGVSGVNLLTLGNPSAVAAAVDASGIRSETEKAPAATT
jgi:5,10-methylenetetrahydrofolate reductase